MIASPHFPFLYLSNLSSCSLRSLSLATISLFSISTSPSSVYSDIHTYSCLSPCSLPCPFQFPCPRPCLHKNEASLFRYSAWSYRLSRCWSLWTVDAVDCSEGCIWWPTFMAGCCQIGHRCEHTRRQKVEIIKSYSSPCLIH